MLTLGQAGLQKLANPPLFDTTRSFAETWTGPAKGCWRHITVAAVSHGI